MRLICGGKALNDAFIYELSLEKVSDLLLLDTYPKTGANR